MVRYKDQTLIRVVLLAFAIGAGSGVAFVSSASCVAITGKIVERDSGSRRVRKSVEDCRYILEICDEACREDVEFREDIDEVSNCEDVGVSRVGASVVAKLLLVEAMMLNGSYDRMRLKR